MKFSSPDYPASIPSRRLEFLHELLGRRIKELTRYSWWAPEEAMRECSLVAPQVFGRTAGPLLLTFDTGIELGVANDPSLGSVVIWIERDEAGRTVVEDPLSSDTDLFPIRAEDAQYASSNWREVLGEKIRGIEILVRRAPSIRMANLPNEVGLSFELEDERTIVAVHGLRNDSDDFAVVKLDELPLAQRRELFAIRIGG